MIEISPYLAKSDPSPESSCTQAVSCTVSSEDVPKCTVPPPPPATDSVHTTWSSPPFSPPRIPPPQASPGSPYTPPRQPTSVQEQACSNGQKNEIEDNSFKVQDVKRKCILSDEVQEILKEEKLDFARLVEAVKKDKMICDSSEGEHAYSDFDYENYPDEYWDGDGNDVTEEDEELGT